MKSTFVLVRELLTSAAMALLLAILLNTFIIQVTDVKQTSMFPTLKEGERLVVLKAWSIRGVLQHGDVVTFQLETSPVAFVKRIIGTPGDTIEIKAGSVWRNGQLLNEPYTNGPTDSLSSVNVFVVPADSYFVMGDNRQHSQDSRAFGAVESRRMIGLSLMRFWPLSVFKLGPL